MLWIMHLFVIEFLLAHIHPLHSYRLHCIYIILAMCANKCTALVAVQPFWKVREKCLFDVVQSYQSNWTTCTSNALPSAITSQLWCTCTRCTRTASPYHVKDKLIILHFNAINFTRMHQCAIHVLESMSALHRTRVHIILCTQIFLFFVS